MSRPHTTFRFALLLALAVLLGQAKPVGAQQKLTADDGTAYDHFGHAVAFADSGDTALIGAYRDSIGTEAGAGSAYLFQRGVDGSFSQDEKFVSPSVEDNDFFGAALALSDAGDTALIGAPGDDMGPGHDMGSAHLFMQAADETWSHQLLMAPDGAEYDEFGTSVALSLDGTTALVGAPKDDTPGGGDAGSAHVWIRGVDGSFSHQAQLFAPDGAAIDVFGSAVALSSTGDTALVGAPQDNTVSGFTVGTAHVFARAADGSWSHQAHLLAPDASGGDRLGAALALSPDGDTALVGAPYDNTAGGTGAGSLHAFTRAGDGSWSHQAQLLAPGAIVSEGFGSAVAFFAAGDAAIVGSPFDDDAGVIDAGSAYLFERYPDGSWNFVERLFDDDGEAYDRFGRSVALSLSANMALVGADDDDAGTVSDAGSARLLDLLDTDSDGLADLADPDDDNDGELDPVETHTGTFVNDSDLGTDPRALDSDGDNWDDGNERDFLTDPTDPASTLDPYSGKLIVIDGRDDDFLGGAVALSAAGDLALVGATHDDTDAGNNAGSARIFSCDAGGTWTHLHTLLAPADASPGYFGHAVSLSGNGATALVGGIVVGPGLGSAQVFQQAADGSWSHEQQLLAPGADLFNDFGASVALSDAGDLALVGDPTQDAEGISENAGVAHVFHRAVDDTWTHEAELVDPNGAAFDEFGASVALSPDGNTAIVGAPQASVDSAGSAHVFTRAEDDTWSHQQELAPPVSGDSQVFGSSVALSASGNTALVGAPGLEFSEEYDGGAHVFTRDATGEWSHVQELPLPARNCFNACMDDFFGSGVALTASGQIALVGARGWHALKQVSFPFVPTPLWQSGRAFLFRQETDGSWVYQHELPAADRKDLGDSFGGSVALSSEGGHRAGRSRTRRSSRRDRHRRRLCVRLVGQRRRRAARCGGDQHWGLLRCR